MLACLCYGFRLCCITSCTREGFYAGILAGCRCCNLARVPCMAERRALCIRLRADFAAGAFKLILCRIYACCRLLQYFGILVRMSLCGLRRASNALTVGIIDVLRLAAYLITTDTFVPVMSSVKRPGCFPRVNMCNEKIVVYKVVCINHHVIF